MREHPRVRAGAVMVAAVLAGCAPSAPPGIFLPTFEPMDTMPAALLVGTLIEDDGCLWIEADGSRNLILWPDGAVAIEDEERLVVHNGGHRAVVGTMVAAGGGQYGAAEYEFVVQLIGEPVPEACRQTGLYWLAGSVQPAGP